MPDVSCRCEVVNYLTTGVLDNPDFRTYEHFYQCARCGRGYSFPEYKGQRVNREGERKEKE